MNRREETNQPQRVARCTVGRRRHGGNLQHGRGRYDNSMTHAEATSHEFDGGSWPVHSGW